MVVPNDALGEVAGDSARVWRVEDGRAVRRDVELGLRGLTLTEVAAGLAPGDWILADAQAGLAPGDRVRVVPAGLPVDASASSTRNELPARLD